MVSSKRHSSRMCQSSIRERESSIRAVMMPIVRLYFIFRFAALEWIQSLGIKKCR